MRRNKKKQMFNICDTTLFRLIICLFSAPAMYSAGTFTDTKVFNCGDIIEIACNVPSCGSVSLRRNDASAVDCFLKNPCITYGTKYTHSCESGVWKFSTAADETDDGVRHICTDLKTENTFILTSMINNQSCGDHSSGQVPEHRKWYGFLALLYIPVYCGIPVAIVDKFYSILVEDGFIKGMYNMQTIASVIWCIIRIKQRPKHCTMKTKNEEGSYLAGVQIIRVLVKKTLCFLFAITPLSIVVYIWQYKQLRKTSESEDH